MKISELVRYLNHLDTLSVHDAMTVSMKEVAKITQVVQYSEVQIDKSGAILLSIQEELQTTLQKYQQQLTQLRSVIQASIEQHEPEYFSASTDNYQQGMRADTPAQVLGRTQTLGADTEKLLCNRLAAYTSWQYPGMVLRPAHCPGLENLVALDPLYLVDTHQDLLDPIRSLFTPNYQRRLRYYVIEEYTSDKIFWNLPSGQFGLVCAFRYFEFKPWEVLQQSLNEIFELLRPGGTFLFSFNDCDHWRSVGLAEHYFCCYTPGRLIREHVKKLGFEITYDYNDHEGTAWLEIKKNGHLDSIRGSQVVAVIYGKANLVPEVIDKTAQELYNELLDELLNELDLDQLIKLARILNVDISEAVTKYNLDFEKVRRTISVYLQSANYSEKHLRRLFKLKENP